METKVYCPDIVCESCIKAVRKCLDGVSGVTSFSVHPDHVIIQHDGHKVTADMLVGEIQKRGYRADLVPFSRKTAKERLRDFAENRHSYDVEYRMLAYSLVILALLCAAEFLAYIFFFQNQALFNRYAIWACYANISVVSIGAAMWHLQSYRGIITTMVGMMIGMTFGMQSGLMIGTIIGATNGVFVGSMAGMAAGVFVGFYNGKLTGIMGVLEGMMAGIMSGIMGAMIGVMLFADHILWFMPFFIMLNIIVMWGLSYMLYEEVVEDNPSTVRQPARFSSFLLFSIIAASLLISIMAFAPKSGLARVVG